MQSLRLVAIRGDVRLGAVASLVSFVGIVVGCRSTTNEPIAAPGPRVSVLEHANEAAAADDTPLPADERGRPRVLLDAKTLARIATEAREHRATWVRLEATCERYATGDVEWPDGRDERDPPDIGEGYQGGGYFHPLLDLALCFRVSRIVDPARARRYGEKAVEILDKMSAPDGPHAVNPLRDSGYGIRFYGVGMAIGYDWVHELLSSHDRTRLRAALARWIDAYEKKGFGHDHPQGNYFAGYYATKALAALAIETDDDAAAKKEWAEFLGRIHREKVAPYYARNLAGGGWPEGWNYGPLGALDMIRPTLAAKTAKGLDLVGENGWTFPTDEARYVLAFTWPSRASMEDRGALYEGPAPSRSNASLVTTLAAVLEQRGDPLAPAFHRFAREVRAVAPPAEPWEDVLYWDESAKEADLAAVPRSYVATGSGAMAARSSWDAGAVWTSFTSGPYVGNPDSGEMYFDQGSVVVVRGDRPVVDLGHAALVRGKQQRGLYDAIYADLFGDNQKDASLGNRTLFNVFYAKARHYGQTAVGPGETRTTLADFEDGGAWVHARGEHLEDMYQKGTVAHWERRFLYVRPDLLLVDDATQTVDPHADRWLAFHTAEPIRKDGGALFLGRDGDLAGAVTPLFPTDATVAIVDVLGRKRASRIEIHGSGRAASDRWLTAIDASAKPRAAKRIATADVLGAVFSRGDRAFVAIFPRGEKLAGEVRYPAPPAASHLVVGLPPNASFSASVQGGDVVVRPGGDLRSSEHGVLAFSFDRGGNVGTTVELP